MAKTIGLTFTEKTRTRRTAKAEAPEKARTRRTAKAEAPEKALAAEAAADKEAADDENEEQG